MTEPRSTNKPALIFALLLLALFSSRAPGQALQLPETLTEKEARSLLLSHEMFKTPRVITLRIGEIQARRSDVERYQPHYPALKSLGLIDLTEVKKEGADSPTSTATETTRVWLTDKGKNESKNWKQTRESEWQVPVATPDIVKIIKIHDDHDRPVGIEFSWTTVPNSIGEALKYTAQIEKAYAKIERSEDGWKIIRIRALSS
jgi:hypothetical protein